MKLSIPVNCFGLAFGVCSALLPSSAAAANIVGAISASSSKPGTVAEVAVWLHASDAGPAPGTKATISQHNLEFSPTLVVITAGQTVAMPNGDDVAHNVFSQSSTRVFNLGIYSKGQSKDVTFPVPGIVHLECSMHRRMKATIVVSPSPHHTVGRVGSRYELANVPAGTYELRAWSEELGEFRGRVAVPERGTAEVKVVLAPAAGK